MAEDDQEYLKLPVEDRCVHKVCVNWIFYESTL